MKHTAIAALLISLFVAFYLLGQTTFNTTWECREDEVSWWVADDQRECQPLTDLLGEL